MRNQWMVVSRPPAKIPPLLKIGCQTAPPPRGGLLRFFEPAEDWLARSECDAHTNAPRKSPRRTTSPADPAGEGEMLTTLALDVWLSWRVSRDPGDSRQKKIEIAGGKHTPTPPTTNLDPPVTGAARDEAGSIDPRMMTAQTRERNHGKSRSLPARSPPSRQTEASSRGKMPPQARRAFWGPGEVWRASRLLSSGAIDIDQDTAGGLGPAQISLAVA